jgi:hypothetical protein
VQRSYANFSYQVGSWMTPHRVIAESLPPEVFGPGGLWLEGIGVDRGISYMRERLVMELSRHANATTTPKVRAYIQVAELATELGVSETTKAASATRWT